MSKSSKMKSTYFLLLIISMNLLFKLENAKTNLALSNNMSHTSKIKNNKNNNSKINSGLAKKNGESSKNKSQSSKSKFLKKMGLRNGFGFDGDCSNSFESIFTSILPGSTGKIMSGIVLPLASAIMSYPQICLGDFDGATIASKTQLANAQCSKLPLNSTHKYGVISFAAYNVPCNDPVQIGVCLVFDDEGTAGIIFNGDLLGCGIAMTGVGKIFQPFIKFIGAMGFGFSLNRQFQKSVNVCYSKDGGIECGAVTSKAHFMFLLNLAIPNFKIGSKDLSKIFQLNATITWMIDLGNVASTVSGLINSLTGNTSCSTGASLLKTIRDAGAEYTVTIDGFLTLLTNSLTNGFIPDIDFTLGNFSFIVTTGGGSTGLKAGIYMHFNSDIIKTIISVVSSFINSYLSMFSDWFSISIPSLDFTFLSAELGLFIDTDMIGFVFKLGFELKCFFKFASKAGSCSFDGKFFTAILEAAKWVITKATKLFEATGEKICEFGNTVGKFSTKAAAATKTFATQKAKEVARLANKVGDSTQKLAEDVSKKTVEGVIAAGKALENMTNLIGTETEKFFNNLGDNIVGFSGDTVSALKDVSGEVANFASNVAGAVSDWTSGAVKTLSKIKW